MPERHEKLHHERSTQFIELLTEHQRKLYAYIAAMLLGDPAAPDVLRETNLELWAKAREIRLRPPVLALGIWIRPAKEWSFERYVRAEF